MSLYRDSVLRDMVLTLSAMRHVDREFVLAELGEDASKQLVPLLNDLDRASFSATLLALSEEACSGLVPQGMTALGAASLRLAAEALSAQAGVIESNKARSQNGLIDRIMRKLIGGQ